MLKNNTIFVKSKHSPLQLAGTFVTVTSILLLNTIFATNSFASGNDKANNSVVPETKEVEAEKPENTTTSSGFSGDYLSSRFSRSNGDIDSATKSLEEVYQQNPQNNDVSGQLMGLYLLGGQVDKAMETAKNIAKNNAKEPISALLLSLKTIKNKDPVTASKTLDAVFEAEGGQLWLPLISAWLDADQKKLLKPIIIEELSAEVGRAAPIINYHLALINAHAGFNEAAAENFKQAITDPTHPPARVMAMMLQFYKLHNSPKTLKPLVEAYKKANPNAADNEKVVFIDNLQDGVAEVLFTMGSIMMTSDIMQEATLYFQLALYLKPDMELATISLAQTYGELQQYKIADSLFAKIPPTSKSYNSVQLYSAINLGRTKQYDAAIAKIDQLITSTPDNTENYMVKGDLLRIQEKYDDAILVYKTALSKLKEIKSVHWVIYYALGTSYDKLKNWVEAEKSLRRSLELSSNQPDSLNYLGYSLLMRGEKLTEAKDLIGKALQKRPNDPQIVDSMGWVTYLLGDYNNAVTYLEQAVSILPADATVNDHLGDVYWRLGRKTEARFQWDRAITYEDNEVMSGEIRKKLADGLPELPTKQATAEKQATTE